MEVRKKKTHKNLYGGKKLWKQQKILKCRILQRKK